MLRNTLPRMLAAVKVQKPIPPGVVLKAKSVNQSQVKPYLASKTLPSHTIKSKSPVRERSKLPYVVGGFTIYVITMYGTYLYIQYRKALKIQQETYIPDTTNDVEHNYGKVFDSISHDYDKLIGGNEFFMGLPLIRRWVLRNIKGHILEVSAGTNRNIGYYPIDQCTSITMVDTSSKMLDEAKRKFEDKYPLFEAVSYHVQDAKQPINSPYKNGFDYVIQTMGVCSHDDPVAVLRNIAQHCKPEGRIILLEHGRSWYDWLNSILDVYASRHAENWGCWWNKDVGQIVEQSGLLVESLQRFHFGTTWYYVLQPSYTAKA